MLAMCERPQTLAGDDNRSHLVSHPSQCQLWLHAYAGEGHPTGHTSREEPRHVLKYLKATPAQPSSCQGIEAVPWTVMPEAGSYRSAVDHRRARRGRLRESGSTDDSACPCSSEAPLVRRWRLVLVVLRRERVSVLALVTASSSSASLATSSAASLVISALEVALCHKCKMQRWRLAVSGGLCT